MADPQVQGFRGLNNVTDPMRLGLEWLSRADNVDVTSTGTLTRRTGFEPAVTAAIDSAYNTVDFTRLYMAGGGTLRQVHGDLATVTLATGLAAAPMQWAELNDRVFFSNGADSGVIEPGGEVLPWRWTVPGTPDLSALPGNLPAGQYQVACTFLLADGRETGSGAVAEINLPAGSLLQLTAIPQLAGAATLVYIAPADSEAFQFAFAASGSSATWSGGPDALGADLTTLNLQPLPAGATVICAWLGSLCAAVYDAEADQSVIAISEPLAPYLFDLTTRFILVPGECRMLAAAGPALVIGTRTAVFAHQDGQLLALADYGVVPGWPATADGPSAVLFWSTRGLCRAMPFQNLTDDRISVAPGLQAGAAVIEAGGEKRFVAVLHAGGTAFNPNPRSSP